MRSKLGSDHSHKRNIIGSALGSLLQAAKGRGRVWSAFRDQTSGQKHSYHATYITELQSKIAKSNKRTSIHSYI
jgi:hypothetical protein